MNLIYTNKGVIPRAKACPNAQTTFALGRDVKIVVAIPVSLY
jgi:hypothetical protein